MKCFYWRPGISFLIRQWGTPPLLMCVRAWVRACMFLSCWCSAVWWRGRGKDSNTCRWPSLKPVGSWPNTSQNPGVRLGRSYPLLPFVMCTLQQIDVSRTAKRQNSEDCFSKTNFILSSSRSLLPPEVSVSRPMVELLSMICHFVGCLLCCQFSTNHANSQKRGKAAWLVLC